MIFTDRIDGGRRLAERIVHLRNRDVVVVGLPRGGVPVAAEVAKALNAPLDVILVRKLGVPSQPELAMGAIGENGVRVLNAEVVQMVGVTSAEIVRVEARERDELERRVERFRSGREHVSLKGRVVIIVDDGIATGSTARAACQVARAHGASHIVLAVPVAPRGWEQDLAGVADEYVCVAAPAAFSSVGQFYSNFAQVTDDDVVDYLNHAVTNSAHVRDEEVTIGIGPDVVVSGHLTVPDRTRGVVVFVHGSGSSRHSPRNQQVASILNQAGIATLLFDLLTVEEADSRANVFDIELLSSRLILVTKWLRMQTELNELDVGYFGASTGAAAALWVAADVDMNIAAVVSRGGRPDLAKSRLSVVRAPTLLIVGSNDRVVLDLNRQASAQMNCHHEVAVVSGASHLFEESGTLLQAARLARDWFLKYLVPHRAR